MLSYNPGQEHGMSTFYDKIVPKNMKNILGKIDPDAAKPMSIDKLDSPSGKSGLGQGFTLFPITPKVRETVMQQGQPLFANGGVATVDDVLSQYDR